MATDAERDDAARDAVALLRAVIEQRWNDVPAIENACDKTLTLRAMTGLAEGFLALLTDLDQKKALEMLDEWQKGERRYFWPGADEAGE